MPNDAHPAPPASHAARVSCWQCGRMIAQAEALPPTTSYACPHCRHLLGIDPWPSPAAQPAAQGVNGNPDWEPCPECQPAAPVELEVVDYRGNAVRDGDAALYAVAQVTDLTRQLEEARAENSKLHDDGLCEHDVLQLQARLTTSEARATKAERRVEAMREVLTQCDVVMDTAALHGLPQQLPPAYRESWAAAHLAVQTALQPQDKSDAS